jgi:NAD-dependent deacetylase
MTAPVAIDPRIIAALREAKWVTILTGAGVSAESGIPTFRDKQTGLWEKFDAAELATPYAFQRDPSLVWGWYEWRRAAVAGAQPNPAHRAIAAGWQNRTVHAATEMTNYEELAAEESIARNIRVLLV